MTFVFPVPPSPFSDPGPNWSIVWEKLTPDGRLQRCWQRNLDGEVVFGGYSWATYPSIDALEGEKR